jgi:Fe-S cluster assembly ATPase SufC
MPLLEIEHLHVEIDGQKILKDLAVNAGEVHAIMPERFGRGGNSGAGAS